MLPLLLSLVPFQARSAPVEPNFEPPASPAAEDASARPALFSWGDLDGDGRLDLAAVGEDGRLWLLADAGAGRFEDVTERVGLASVRDAALALWADYDADGKLDLFVGARAGASRLFHNEGAEFVDMSAASGLTSEGAVRSAEWIDHDRDGRPDLLVVTDQGSALFRGLEGGFFERSELPFGSATGGPEVSGGWLGASEGSGERPVGQAGAGTTVVERRTDFVRRLAGTTRGGGASSGTAPILTVTPAGCFSALRDQATASACLQASTTPQLGLLYPLSTNLFVAASGEVGIGTTSPTAKLEVAGTARVTDTLTLNPAGDLAADIATGSVYKAGKVFLHTKGGLGNTGVGREALANVGASGSANTASGDRALFGNTTGRQNSALGSRALFSNTTGSRNTASGERALYTNTSGVRNTSSGYRSLYSNTTGNNNVAVGDRALYRSTTGENNTASGYRALNSNTTGSFNTAVGDRALFTNTTGTFNAAVGYRALYSNTTGQRNVALGDRALFSNTTGLFNTATGYRALFYNTAGARNVANGDKALLSNTTGVLNTATGSLALSANTTGGSNTATGYRALFGNTTGQRNSALGQGALQANTTGSQNIAIGRDAGSALTTGNDNIAIGNPGGAPGEASTIRIGTVSLQTRAFVAGIRGVTTGVADAIPVVVDSAGQLGTISSSRRFKEDIQDMGDLSARLLALRPVVFRYKPEVQSGARPLEYGLIAEEVAEVFPDLVVYDEAGQPFTVKYHLLSALLLNELQKVHERLEAQTNATTQELAELRERLATLEGRLEPRAAPTATR